MNDANVVLADEHQIVVTEVQQDTVVVEVNSQLVVVGVAEQGPPGPMGPAGSGGIEVNFSFGDATPAVLATVPAGKLIYGVKLHIKTPFDGVGAQLTVGDAGDFDRLMADNENDPKNIGSNETNPAYAYEMPTQLLLSITAGAGASQGSGLATIYIQQ